MKSTHYRLLILCFVSLFITLGVSFAQAQTTYTWTGGTSTAWTLPANWSGTQAPTNNAYFARLNVNASNNPCTYTAAEGYTIYTNTSANKVLVIASTVNGAMVISGGTFDSRGGLEDIVGNSSGVGTLTIDGGTYVNTNSGSESLFIPLNSATGTLNVNSGLAAVTSIYLGVNAGGTGNGTINLNGGVLAVGKITTASTTYLTTNNFNGGILRALASGSIISSQLKAVNVLAGGAIVDSDGFNISIGTALLNGNGGADGGLTKIGNGTLTLSESNTYNGPTIVQNGTLALQLPLQSTNAAVANGAGLTVATDSLNPWDLDSLALTNSTLTINYATFSGYTNAVIAVTSLQLSGTVTIDVSGTSFPVTNITLLTYGNKTGGGSFVLGSLPAGASAVLTDTGSALQLSITQPSVQTLTWYSGGDGLWQVNGGLDWNNGTAVYLEYPSGTGDDVIFDDADAGVVTIPSTVKPASMTINNPTGFYAFTGNGDISGPGALDKLGSAIATIFTTNDFSGGTTVSGGSLQMAVAGAIGAGLATVSSGASLSLENGITVTNSVTISGPGLDGARGALRSVDTGNNIWAGPVIIGDSAARIGTLDGGTLTVSGTITAGNNNFSIIFRPDANGTLIINNPSNSWQNGTTFYGDNNSTPGTLILASTNVIPVAPFYVGPGNVDLDGNNLYVAGLDEDDGAGTILNNGDADAALILSGTNSYSFSGPIIDGSSKISIVVNGGSHTFGANNTYTGGTVVNGGLMAVTLPMSSAALTVASNATLSVNVANNSWAPATMNVTNATLDLSYGMVSGVPGPVLSVSTLNVSGSNVVNITGTNIPVASLTLISYSSIGGGGAFYLGSIPSNMVATLTDIGSAIVLNVSASPQTLVWYGTATGTWNTNETSLDWNDGTAAYEENGPATNRMGGAVTFDDTASIFLVDLTQTVRPASLTVNNTTNTYTFFSGGGQISGPTSLIKLGTNLLALNSSNSYTGGSMVENGTLQVADPNALGVNGNLTVVSSGATLALAGGIVVSNGIVEINGAGVGNFGALSGTNGYNIWAGPVIVADTNAITQSRVGARATATLEISGPINSTNGIIVRNEPTGTVVFSGPNSYAGSTFIFSDTLRCGAANTLPAASVVSLGTSANTALSGILDLNGYNQTVAGLTVPAGASITNIVGNSSTTSDAVLTIESSQNTANIFSGTIEDSLGSGTHKLGLVLAGGVLTLAGTNTYTGSTTIEGGELILTGSLGGTAVTVTSGGSLGGSGTVNAPVIVQAGGTLSPGNSPVLGGALTIENSLALTGSTVISIGAVGSSLGNNGVNVLSNVNFGGTLVVTNVNGASLAAGNVFALFSVTGTATGNFSNGKNVTVLPSSLGLTGTFNPATGQLTLASNNTPPVLNFTNTAGGLLFSWPADHLGWQLQTQTNSLSTGLSNNWFIWPGSTNVTSVSITVDPTAPAVFFRLANP